MDDQSPGQGYALLLTTRKLGRAFALDAGKFYEIKHAPYLGLLGGLASSLKLEAKSNIFGDRKEGEKVGFLKHQHRPAPMGRNAQHTPPVEDNVTIVGHLDPSEQFEQGRFAAT